MVYIRSISEASNWTGWICASCSLIRQAPDHVLQRAGVVALARTFEGLTICAVPRCVARRRAAQCRSKPCCYHTALLDYWVIIAHVMWTTKCLQPVTLSAISTCVRIKPHQLIVCHNLSKSADAWVAKTTFMHALMRHPLCRSGQPLPVARGSHGARPAHAVRVLSVWPLRPWDRWRARRERATRGGGAERYTT